MKFFVSIFRLHLRLVAPGAATGQSLGRSRFGSILLRTAGVSLLLATAIAFSAEPEMLNGLVAIVNDKVITWKDVDRAIMSQLPALAQTYGRNPAVYNQRLQKLKEDQIEELVEKELILHEYKTAGYNLPESYIESKISEDVRSSGDRLSMMKNLQARGLTYERYREQVRERYIVQAMWEHNVPKDPIISPHKIETYYQEHPEEFKVEDEVKLRIIIFPKQSSGPIYSPKKMAEETLKKIEEGVPFGEMASIYSEGSKRSANGEWFERPALRADLADKAFALKKGEHSGVIEAEDGCYLMFVEDRRPAHLKPLSEVREQIESNLKDQEKNRLRKKWIQQLKKKSFVQYF